jgi:AcrR family transcriptional regulator
MKPGWRREDAPDAATSKILDAAEKAFGELGVSATGMAEVAEFAGCSRGTLYRYFKNRHELHVAYVRRTSRLIQRRVAEAVADIEDPRERLVESILRSVREVRRNPATAAWFAPAASGLAARMSRSAEVTGSLAEGFLPDLPGSSMDRAERRFRQRWLVRVIVSLLADPGESAAEERAMIERFVAPSLLPAR